jgi:hypothetical protein
MAARRGTILACACLTAVAGGCGGSERADAPQGPRAVPLAGCWMTVHLFKTPVERLRGLVAAGYRLGDYFSPREATLAIWVMACDRAGAGRDAAPAVLSMIGVQVAPPVRVTGPTDGPAAFHHYLLAADTNSRVVRGALRAAGQPVRLVPGLRFRRGRGVTAVNPAPRGGFTAAIRAKAIDRRHSHRNAFWFGPAARPLGFELRFPAANDRYCLPSRRGCVATVTAPAGSKLWTLLGSRAPARANTGFDHLKIRAGSLVIR